MSAEGQSGSALGRVLCPVRTNERTHRCNALLISLIARKYSLFPL
jgi:hypothetical protein